MKPGNFQLAMVIMYQVGLVGTWVFLMFFDGKSYQWWGWILAAGINGAIASFWPVYWIIIRPVMWILGWLD